MKKVLAIFPFVLCAVTVYSQSENCKIDTAAVIRHEIQRIIDSSHRYHIKGDPSFEVFIARFYYLDGEKRDISFTLGSICNSHEYNSEYTDVKGHYYMEMNNEYILVKLPDNNYAKLLSSLNLKDFYHRHSFDAVHIVQKLYPNEVGFESYHACGITCSFRDCHIEDTFYDNYADIPDSISVYEPISGLRLMEFKNDTLKQIQK